MKRIMLAALAGMLALVAGAKGPSQVVVMSYNIRFGDANDGTNSWVYRYRASSMMLEDQAPDVVGLQEALGYQVEYLKEYVNGYKAIGVGREDGRKAGEYMAILYNKKTVKLLKWGTFWLSETPEKPSLGWDAACRRTATWAFFKDKRSGRKFLMVNTHLDHVGREARIRGMALVLEYIKKLNTKDLPVVLTGDFNSAPDDEALKAVGIRMKNARDIAFATDRGSTFNGWGKASGVIDHIFFTGFSSCPSFEVVKKPYDERTFISDHYPVKATLIL